MRDGFLTLLLIFAISEGSKICPDGYTQAPNGGNCFTVKSYGKDWFSGQYPSKSFDGVEFDCNQDGGGLLAAIHSQEENDLLYKLPRDSQKMNIGLRCKGSNCKWDDGSPLTYSNFEGAAPIEDGQSRCYGVNGGSTTWKEVSCGDAQDVGWGCSVKAKMIDCTDGETAYKGGCVSVQTTPLDQKSAEASCPGRGHLVSIHSGTENNFYRQLALNAGVNGPMYIGGQFYNGIFEWTDGSHYNTQYWTNPFPNTIYGSCSQMMLAADLGFQGQWANVECTVQQPYMCFRDGSDWGPTEPPQPLSDAQCPATQNFTQTWTETGTIFSPNFPVSIPSQQSCEYLIQTRDYTWATVKFSTYDCQSGTVLSLFDGFNSTQPFATFTSVITPVLGQGYYASKNFLRMVFTTSNASAPVGTGWELQFGGR